MTIKAQALKSADGAAAQRLMHELEGFLIGISADHRIVSPEIERLTRWLDAAAPFSDRPPFAELVTKTRQAIADGVLTLEEIEDLLFVTSKLTTVNPHFDAVRGGLQQLHGVLAGVAADGIVNDDEAHRFEEWVDDWSHLRGLWPYDECEALLTVVLTRSAQAREAISALLELAKTLPIGGADFELTPPLRGGICAVNPDLEFVGRTFVFTGESSRGPRDVLEAAVMCRGGAVGSNVTQHTDYLITCSGGSPHWAFACYGRKIEYACKLRQRGHRVLIVHEIDLWDALN